MRKLYEIRSDIQDAIEWAMYGEESGIPEIPTPLEDLEIEAEEKIRNCFFAVNKLNAEAAEADVVIKQAQDYKAKRVAAIARIEEDIRVTMEFAMMDKIDQPDCRVTLMKPREMVGVIDESLIPAEFLRIIPESKAPDKKTILEALKAGKDVGGCALAYGKPGLKYPKIKGE